MINTRLILSSLFRIVLFVLGTIFLLDGLYLLALKKIHLGIILPFLIGIGFVTTSLFWHAIQAYLAHSVVFKTCWYIGWVGFTVWLLSVGLFFFYIQNNMTNNTNLPTLDAIIVLGSGTQNGEPSPTLAQRLDTAAQYAKQHQNAKIVLSGGVDFNENISEAEVMQNYLIQHYTLAKDRFILEKESTSTALNLKNSAVLLKAHHLSINSTIGIVTSDFHTLRSKEIAKKQGFTQIYMISAPTPLLTRYNAWLREYFAFISGKLLNEY